MKRLPLAITLSLLLCPVASALAQPSSPIDAMKVRQAFDASIPHSPTPATIGNAKWLFYEIHLTNFARVPLTLSAVDVLDEATGRVVHRLEGAALTQAVGGPGINDTGERRRMVETGRRAVIYVQVALIGAAPLRLRHRVEYDVQAPAGTQSAVLEGIVTPLRPAAALPTLGPPLRGGPWAAIYDPALINGHRRYVYAVGGQARIPGRFAIDWMQAGPQRERLGDVGGALGAGAPVLAVADAIVAGTRDGVAETGPGLPRPPVALADATGNYIALALGGGRYAFYEHLAPELLVKPGDLVRRGQVIAHLGSTGQASRPHLHFHVADANAPLAAEGQPYLLTGARVVGAYLSIAAFEAGDPWRPASGAADGPALPPPNTVVMFNNATVIADSARR